MTINAIPNPGNSNSGTLDQFLQPQSMVTPGALGALAMLGTNSLTGSFQSEDYYPIVALALSFLFGFAALVKSTSILEKCFYYMINSIIIFSVAAGTNKLGQQVQHASLPLPSLSAFAASRMNTDGLALSPEHVQFFKEWFPNQQNQLKSDTPASRRPSPQNERDPTTPASRRPDPDQQNEPAPTAPASKRPDPNR
jgi:hypothetical protein